MSKKLIINEEEKSEILKKHTDFKQILQNNSTYILYYDYRL